ncbi:MAG: type VI secretion system baseplate subunit TssK, partial [Bryobacteraceae bacterium]
SYVPELRHILKTRRGHPEPLFVGMLRLAGALSTFAAEKNPPELPDYDHENLGVCFKALDARIRYLLDVVIPVKCISVPLGQTSEQFIWRGVVEKAKYFQDTEFYLSIAADLPVDELIEKVPRLVRIAGPDEMPTLVRYALPGVKLHYLPVPPPQIPYRLGRQYFQLDTKDHLWRAVMKSQSIYLSAQGEFPNLEAEVLIVLK